MTPKLRPLHPVVDLDQLDEDPEQALVEVVDHLERGLDNIKKLLRQRREEMERHGTAAEG